MKKLIGFAICLIAVLGSSGCGGSGSPAAGSSVAAFAGSYGATYNTGGPTVRAYTTGQMTIAVATNGLITITVVDSAEGTFVGTGIANHVGGFYITVNGIGNKQVTVNGTLKGTGLGRTAQGTIAGTIVVDFNAAFLHDPDVTVFTNHYEGSYAQGSKTGEWLGDITTGGVFAGQLVVGNSTVNLSGNVYSNGSFKFAGKNSGTTYEATGIFRLDQSLGVVCNGLLKGKTGSTTVSGAFSGQNAIGG